MGCKVSSNGYIVAADEETGEQTMTDIGDRSLRPHLNTSSTSASVPQSLSDRYLQREEMDAATNGRANRNGFGVGDSSADTLSECSGGNMENDENVEMLGGNFGYDVRGSVEKEVSFLDSLKNKTAPKSGSRHIFARLDEPLLRNISRQQPSALEDATNTTNAAQSLSKRKNNINISQRHL